VVQEGTRVDRNARTEGDEEVDPSPVKVDSRTCLGAWLRTQVGLDKPEEATSPHAKGCPSSWKTKHLHGLTKPNELMPAPARGRKGGFVSWRLLVAPRPRRGAGGHRR